MINIKNFSHWLTGVIANLTKRQLGLIVFIIYLVTIFLNSLIRHGVTLGQTSLCPQVTFFSTPNDITHCFGGADIASYVRGAFALEEHGLNAFSSLGFGTWPPGFSLLELILIRLNVVPLPLALFLVASSLWAFVFFRLYALLKQSVGLRAVYAAGLPMLLLLVPFVSDFYLWNGILMSEPISTALFAIATLDLWRLVASKLQITLSRAIFIGVLFALAAYIKAQFDLIVDALVVVSFVVIAINYYLKKHSNKHDCQELKKLSKSIFVIFLSYQACVLPYKSFMAVHGHGANMASVTYIFESVWQDENRLIQNGAGFFVSGGGNSMCVISPLKCREFKERRAMGETISINEYRNSAFKVALTQPLDLLSFKLPYFWKSWKVNNYEDPFKQTWLILFNYALFALIFLASVCRIIKNRTQGLAELALFSALFVGSTAFSFIVHFEPRYLLPVKLFGVFWVMVAIASIGKSFVLKNGRSIQVQKLWASLIALRSKYYWKMIAVKNSTYWKTIAVKNAVYWHFYNGDGFARLIAIANNLPIWFSVAISSLAGKLARKKVVVVFLLQKSHYGWVKEVLANLQAQQKFAIQVFSPDDLSGLSLKERCFSTKGIVPTKSIQLIPSLWADLYITPASTTACNASYSDPKVMFMHSLVSIYGVYEENTFDGYDYIYCTGKHHVEEFHDLFRSKGLSGKCLIPGGYPKLDELLERTQKIDAPNSNRVIFAPTLLSEATENVTLMSQAHSLVSWFVGNGWSVLFRPHPINLEAGNKYLPIFEELINSFSDCDAFEVDRSKDYFDSYSRSSLMVSDVSGTAYTYALGFGRPVMFVEKSSDSAFARGLLYKNRHRLGRTISSDSELPVAISFLMANYADFTQDIKNLRNECIFNIGSSAKYFANNIEFILGGKKHLEWTYV